MTQLESGIYVVHSVESGSVLTLFSPSQPNVPPFQISLTGVVCPRVARFVGQELVSDEPLGFEAREFVRKRIIGKSVQFTNDGKIEAIQRVVGRISLQDGEDIGLALATSGLGHVQERQGKGSREYMEKLIIANEKAKDDRIGIYAKDAAIHVRNMKPAPPEDPHALFSVLQKDPKHKVLVERVTSGSSMIATIIAFNQQCALNMWGISCPSLREPSTEKVALEAKFHTERCLLHREIHISFVSVSPNGSFNVNVVSGTNIFQEDLLRRGLAKTMQSVLMGSASREQFIAAEKSAQERKLGVWLDYAVPQTLGLVDKISSDYRGDRSFVGKVFQILSGDTICVYRENVKELVKLSLASVRPSRSIIRDQDGKDTRIRYENYTYEAREALRRFCIGKEVQVCIDYVRTIEETKELRPYATVVLTSTNQNVGEYLISEGLAKAMCHGQEVASCVEQLRDAESLAIQKKIGLHSSKESPPVRMVELFRPTEKKARQYLSYFQRGAQAGRPPRLNAIVEMVLGASMIRVCIPSESTIITLKLAGVMGPQGANADSPADLLADEAKHFVMDLIQNRDVMIEVETVDKHGTFLGSLYHDGQNLGITLVKKGLAVVANADRLPFVAELKSAEKQAQNARIGVWKEEKYMPARVLRSKERHERLAPGTLVMSPGEKFVPIMVTEVLNPTAVYMSFLDDSTKSRRGEVEALLQSFVETHDKYSPKKDEMVIAKFSEDNTWYRARVLNVNVDDKKNRTFHVRYIDFGNTETRLATDIRKCEHDKLRTLAPLAFEAYLAFLKPLPKMFHAIVTDSIRAYLEDATKLYAKQEYICGTQKYYSINKQPEGNEEALAFKLAESGTGVVHPPLLQVDNSDIKRIVGELTRRQEAAQKSSANVWQYGTALIEDDDEDNE